ncbi:MAG: hypothetical protein IKZ87_01255 [Actinomycetaceae bacterium]|nr:hypothetical protein [Actinomycetaceae bacterium]
MYSRPYEDSFANREASHPISVEQDAAFRTALKILPQYASYNPEADNAIAALKSDAPHSFDFSRELGAHI